jgi:hypothetical protein
LLYIIDDGFTLFLPIEDEEEGVAKLGAGGLRRLKGFYSIPN